MTVRDIIDLRQGPFANDEEVTESRLSKTLICEGRGLGMLLQEARQTATAPAHRSEPAKNGAGTSRYYKWCAVRQWLVERNLVWDCRPPKVDKMVDARYKEQLLGYQKTIQDLQAQLSTANLSRMKAEKELHLSRSVGSGFLSTGEVLELARPVEKRCGIYFLIKQQDIVYIGQSINIMARVGSHLADKDFDCFSYVLCEQKLLNEIEAIYIVKFDPPLNGTKPKGVAMSYLDRQP